MKSKYSFRFYKKEDFEEIERLIINSYSFDYPVFGLSRMEFSNGLHPKFLSFNEVWEKTVGIFTENGKIVSCAINEGNDEGDVFFVFEDMVRAGDEELLAEMLFFAKTTMSCVEDENQIKRFVTISVPEWNITLKNMVQSQGFSKNWQEKLLIRNFTDKKTKYEVKLPEGYVMADGRTTPSFYLSNVHMAAFNYSIRKVPDCANAFADMRRQKHYNPLLDLCILDEQGRPVAMANIWYDEKMPYCELEPLGVAWWERRKGLATSILNEASNRIMDMYPKCTGMLGGDQKFYEKIGFELKAVVPNYKWEKEIYPSWDKRSDDR